HHTPPPYLAAITAHKIAGPVREWTREKSLADMDRAGVATALTSITTPALRFLDDAGARKLARECNEYSAKLAAHSQGRVGPFAAAAGALGRAHPAGAPLRFRPPQGRRHGPAHELGRQVARRPGLRAGQGGAEPPQGRGLHPSHHRQLLRQPDSRRAGVD